VAGSQETARCSEPYPNHEVLGELIVTSQSDLVEAIGGLERAKKIAAIFRRTESADSQLSKLIHSSFDMDRLDYLLRDAQATGVPYGQIDIHYLLNHLRMSPSGLLGIERKALPAVEHFLLARFFMHKAVYYHKTTFGFEECCRQLLRRAKDRASEDRSYNIPTQKSEVEDLVKSERLSGFTDDFVDRVIHQALGDSNIVMRSLARAIYDRKPPKLIKEVTVLEDKSHQQGGKIFLQNCRFQLTELARKLNIPLGCLLLCEHKPLRFEERPRLFDRNESTKLPRTEREETIMIFNGPDEPVPIMDVASSIIQPLSQLYYQSTRLYCVMPDGESSNEFDNVVSQLKQATKGWES
jgi:HD superfamily phosphohydrolase